MFIELLFSSAAARPRTTLEAPTSRNTNLSRRIHVSVRPTPLLHFVLAWEISFLEIPDGTRQSTRTWRRRLQRQQASGLTIRDFCALHDLHESAFYFWRREIAARDEASVRDPVSTPAFMPVQVIEAPTLPKSFIDIRLASGHRLRVSAGCDRQLLADVVAVLEGKPC